MRTLSTAVTAALSAGRIAVRDMVLLDLPSGFYGFWTGVAPFVHNGMTYQGAGALLDVQLGRAVAGTLAVPLTVRARAMPSHGVTADVLATIEDEDYHQRPLVYSQAFFEPQSGALLSVDRVWSGAIDVIAHSETPGGDASMDLICESRMRDVRLTTGRLRADPDQRRVDASDGGFRHVSAAGAVRVDWGRTTEVIQ